MLGLLGSWVWMLIFCVFVYSLCHILGFSLYIYIYMYAYIYIYIYIYV